MKKIVLATGFALCTATSALAEGETHHVAFQVNANDPQVMNLALNNAQNVAAHFAAQGDEVLIEVVAYGPGLNMFIDGKSPVADRIETMALEMDGKLTFAACGNTLKKMTAKLGAEPPLIEEAHVVTAGVIRLMELQDEGYAYIKP